MSELVGASPSSGSPFGLSYWSQFIGQGCSRRATLDKAYGNYIDWESPHSDPLSVGSIFHKILEHYYRNDGSLEKLIFQADNPNVTEALRLFNGGKDTKGKPYLGYKSRFPKEEFGAAQTEFTFSLAPEQTEELLGVAIPLSGKVDVVAHLTAKEIPLLQAAPRLLSLAEPGVYLLDHKTMRAKPSATENSDPYVEFRERLQFIEYMLAWNYLHPGTPCKGFITNAIVKHQILKDDSFFSLLGGPPSGAQKRALSHFLFICKKNKEIYGPNFANPAGCFSWGKPCVHFSSGACERY